MKANKPKSPKVDIETYYKRRGLTYEHVRKINRNYVRYDGPSSEVRGRVYLDTFVPPPGYSVDELPNVDSQPTGQSHPNVSPAILTAERNRVKFRQPLQKASSKEFDELFARLTRKKTTSESDSSKGVGIAGKENSNPSPELNVQITSTQECLNTTFPEMDEDLNESALVRLTQAAEIEFAKESCTQMEVGGNTQPRKGPLCASTPKLVNVTPTQYSDVTPRRSARISSSAGSRSRCTSCSCCSDESSSKRPSKRNSGVNHARKSLFTKPAGRPPTPNVVVGDMDEDGNDDLFSQMLLPDLEGGGGASNSRSIRNADASDHPTFGDSVLQTSSFLNEIDRMEEIALGVGCNQMPTLNQDLQTLQTQICDPSDIFNLTTQQYKR